MRSLEDLLPKRFLSRPLSAFAKVGTNDPALAWRLSPSDVKYRWDSVLPDKCSEANSYHRVFRFACDSCQAIEAERMEHTEFCSAFTVVCSKCQERVVIHFGEKHGWDAFANREMSRMQLPSLEAVPCRDCNSRDHELVVDMLYYPESLQEAREDDPTLPLEEAYEDLHIYSKCSNCGLVDRWVAEVCS